MDAETRAEFGNIRSTIDQHEQNRRESTGKLHEKINDTGKEVIEKFTRHEKEDAIAFAILQQGQLEITRTLDRINRECMERVSRAAKIADDYTRRVEVKVDEHTKWHKDKRKEGRGVWFAIGMTLLAALGSMIQNCM